MQDYYDTLEINKNASDAEIKKAYRRLALKYHPDRNPGDKKAEDNFKQINEAYACLSDQQKRSYYDTYGTSEGIGADFGFGDFATNFGDIFGDIFSDFFGTFSGKRRTRPTKGHDLRYDLDLNLSDAVFGTDKKIKIPRWELCASCNGNGSKDGSHLSTCGTCNGTGQTKLQQGFFTIAKTCGKCSGSGNIITIPCGGCKGEGKIKKQRTVSLKVPGGLDSGIKLKVSGEGEAGIYGGPPGDLYVVISVAPHPFFKRKGNDLHCEVPITFVQATLGGEMEVPTMDGKEHIRIPHGTPSGRVFHLRGKGVPRLGSHGRGDQFVTVYIDVPKKLTPRQKELLQEFAHLSGEETPKGFVDKIKDIFKEEAQ
jgi:molecular chaperone DnaJ